MTAVACPLCGTTKWVEEDDLRVAEDSELDTETGIVRVTTHDADYNGGSWRCYSGHTEVEVDEHLEAAAGGELPWGDSISLLLDEARSEAAFGTAEVDVPDWLALMHWRGRSAIAGFLDAYRTDFEAFVAHREAREKAVDPDDDDAFPGATFTELSDGSTAVALHGTGVVGYTS